MTHAATNQMALERCNWDQGRFGIGLFVPHFLLDNDENIVR